MEPLFIQVLNRSISAGWMILAVLTLRLVLRRLPKWTRVVLWGLAGLRLSLPCSVQSAFSLLPSAQTIRTSVQYARHPSIQSGIQSIDSAVNPLLGTVLAAGPENSVNPVQIWLFVGSVVWLAGLTGLMLYGAVSTIRLKRRVRASVPLEETVLLCDEVTTPFVLGVLRPRIYLPSGMDEAERDYVLAHERAHFHRGDHLWKPLAFFLLAVHWFHPLVWLAYALLCRDIELACDERVIRDLNPQEKKEYAHALVSCSLQRRTVLVCPLAFGEVGVKQRVKEVLHYRKPAFWIVAAAVAACVAMAVCFLTDPLQQNAAPDVTVDSSSDQQDASEQYRTDYIGDATKVSQIAMRLPYPEGWTYGSIEIQSQQEPYGLTVLLHGAGDSAPRAFEAAAKLAFDSIGNLGTIRFCESVSGSPMASFTRTAAIDYGTSALYSKEDMDAAIQLILSQFGTWEGCELHSLRYASDDCNSTENIQWLNELAQAQGMNVTFTRCMEFLSDYHSPADPVQAGAWNADEEYTDWQWWLGCTEDGVWHLMSWGY